MATRIVGTGGHRRWMMSRDSDGHREYKIVHRIEGSRLDGPANALRTPGLPLPGSSWNVDGDVDNWAFCLYTANVVQVAEDGKPNIYFDVEQTFSTKNPLRCSAQQIENPLLEPAKISGTFTKHSEEAVIDKDGNPVVNSSHEQVRGPNVEFDILRLTIRIEQNVAALNGTVIDGLKDSVNDAVLWGFQPRCVKIAGINFEKKYYGTCFPYYTRILEFETNTRSFDRWILDEGTKVLRGRWNTATGQWELVSIAGSPPDRRNPAHFIRFYDWNGNYCRTLLDGFGKPVNAIGTGAGTSWYEFPVQKYQEANFLILGIPPVI